jgi:hypothetical protein
VKIIETGEALSDDAIIDMVRPSTSDLPQPESDDDAPASPPRKITTKMATSNIKDTLVFLEAHPQLPSKHLKPLLSALADIKHLSSNSAKQTSVLDFFFSENN